MLVRACVRACVLCILAYGFVVDIVDMKSRTSIHFMINVVELWGAGGLCLPV